MKTPLKTALVVIVTLPVAAMLVSWVLPEKNPYEAGRKAFYPSLFITVLVALLAHKEFKKRERKRMEPPLLPRQSPDQKA